MLFIKKITPYLDPNNPGSFIDLYQQINQVKERADENRAQAISEVSQLLKSSNKLLRKNWNLLRNHVEALQQVQEKLEAAHKIVNDEVSEATNYRNSPEGKSFFLFADRQAQLQEDIRMVYKNSLYPFLLVLQNAEKGWNPSSLFCQVCDLYSCWKIKDPRSEVKKALENLNTEQEI